MVFFRNLLALNIEERFKFGIAVVALGMFCVGVAALVFNIPLATACLIGAYVGDQLVKG